MRILIAAIFYLLIFNTHAYSGENSSPAFSVEYSEEQLNYSFLTSLSLTLRYAKKFHPLNGQKFSSLEEEFAAWDLFIERFRLAPRLLVMQRCNLHFSKPKNLHSKYEAEKYWLAKCRSWGWPPAKESSLWNFVQKSFVKSKD